MKVPLLPPPPPPMVLPPPPPVVPPPSGTMMPRRGRLIVAAVTAALVVGATIIRGVSGVIGIAVVFALLAGLERLFPLRRAQRTFRNGWKTDLVHLLVNQMVSGVLLIATAGVAVAVLLRVRPQFMVDTVASQPLWLQGTEMLIVFVLTNYVMHRASHEIPALWRFHSVHHSITEMDWLASARLHPVDRMIMTGTDAVVLTLAGFSFATLSLTAGVGAVLSLIGLLVHANIRIRLPYLRWVIPNPEWHHWHHAATAEAVNHNYSPLPVVDVLFGTAYLPASRPESYGITDPVPASGYLAQLGYPFKRR